MHDQVSTWLTRAEAAAYARVSCATIDRWIRSGRITKYVVGTRSVRLKRSEIDDAIVQESVNA